MNGPGNETTSTRDINATMLGLWEAFGNEKRPLIYEDPVIGNVDFDQVNKEHGFFAFQLFAETGADCTPTGREVYVVRRGKQPSPGILEENNTYFLKPDKDASFTETRPEDLQGVKLAVDKDFYNRLAEGLEPDREQLTARSRGCDLWHKPKEQQYRKTLVVADGNWNSRRPVLYNYASARLKELRQVIRSSPAIK